jgi:hypothetical protein
MVRTAFLSALTAAGLILPVATVNAAPPVVIYPSVAPVYYPPAPIVRTWTVRYRNPGWGQWHFYARFASPYAADAAARNLQWRGFEAAVGIHG